MSDNFILKVVNDMLLLCCRTVKFSSIAFATLGFFNFYLVPIPLFLWSRSSGFSYFMIYL